MLIKLFEAFQENNSANFHTQTVGIWTTSVQQSSNSILSSQITKYLSTIFSFGRLLFQNVMTLEMLDQIHIIIIHCNAKWQNVAEINFKCTVYAEVSSNDTPALVFSPFLSFVLIFFFKKSRFVHSKFRVNKRPENMHINNNNQVFDTIVKYNFTVNELIFWFATKKLAFKYYS